jgi:hypothetical protein
MDTDEIRMAKFLFEDTAVFYLATYKMVEGWGREGRLAVWVGI